MVISDNAVHTGDFILDGMFATILGAPVIFIGAYILLQLTAALLAHVSRLSRSIHVRRVFSRQTIIAHYEPPQGVHPAEMAFLYDQTFGKEEYLATLFDLERRGYITIAPLPTATILSSVSNLIFIKSGSVTLTFMSLRRWLLPNTINVSIGKMPLARSLCMIVVCKTLSRPN